MQVDYRSHVSNSYCRKVEAVEYVYLGVVGCEQFRDATIKTVDNLNEYTLDWSKGSKRRHIDGERVFVERYIRLEEFDLLFGGSMLLSDPSGKVHFIGVWGRQAISQFKRVLRQRGAEFVVLHADAHDRVKLRYSQYYGQHRT